jgi:hypothetical protein
MRPNRLRTITVGLAVLAASVVFSAPTPAQAVTTGSVIVYQGDIYYWWYNAGTEAVASVLSQADVLIISHAKDRDPGPSGCGGSGCWPNYSYGATGDGCSSENHRSTWITILARIAQLNPNQLQFGYVSGAADAPNQGSLIAQCGNNVNNYKQYISPQPASTTFTACPGAGCMNFVSWVGDWFSGGDALPGYMDGIFIDYVNSVQMNTTIRDNLYSYVRSFTGKRIAVNSLVPGSPCAGCPGNINNYQFAVDSSYLNAGDYILVEGYYAAGYSGNGGVATINAADTSQIGGNVTGYPASTSIRTTIANSRGVKPLLAALVTEPSDAAFNTLSCSWSDFTNAKAIFNASAVSSSSVGSRDVIGFQFADLGLDLSNSPPSYALTVCS